LKPVSPARRTSPAKLKTSLERRPLGWHPAVRVAWFSARQSCHLFVDGEHHPLPERLTGFAELLGASRALDTERLQRLAANPQVQSLLLAWLDAGQLVWDP